MMHKKILFSIMFFGNFASLFAMTYQTSYQRAVDELMKEKILKSRLANEEYEVADKRFKGVLISDATGEESVQQVVDRMANIFFSDYQEQNLKFDDTARFIKKAIRNFIDQLLGQREASLLTPVQLKKYEALWDYGDVGAWEYRSSNIEILIEKIWEKMKIAGLDNPVTHQFVYDNYFYHTSFIYSGRVELIANKIKKFASAKGFQQMIANFNAPAVTTSTAIVANSPASMSLPAQAATLSAFNSVLTQSDSSISFTQESSDSSVSFTQGDIEDAFESVRDGSATPEQVSTVLQTVAVTPEVVKKHPSIGSFVTINTLMNLLFVRYGASQSIVLDQHNIGQFIQDHPDIFEQLVAQGLIIVSEPSSPAEGGSVVPAVDAAESVASLTPEAITQITETVRPVYKNWVQVQSTIAQVAADSLSGVRSSRVAGVTTLTLPAAAQAVVGIMQKGADDLIDVVHQANIALSLQPQSSTASVQPDVVLMVPLTDPAGGQARGQAAQDVTTIPLVTTAQQATLLAGNLNNPAPLPAGKQRLVNKSVKQALGISPTSTNFFNQDLLEILSGSHDDQVSTVSLSPLTPASPSSPNLDWLSPSSSTDDDQLDRASQIFAQTVAKNGMILARALLDHNIEEVTHQNIVSMLVAKNIQIDGLSDSSNMAYLIGYVQRCVWFLQQAASAQRAIKMRKIVLVVKQLIKNSGQARS